LDLLRQFARENSQDAFNEIVRRHLNLVYSAARRQVRSPQLAEEIAQSVFTDLARNAGKLKPGTILTAWLYSVTRWTAIDVVHKESRRQLREQIAVEMNDMNATANDWTQIEPLLDDAMAALDETDRSAILLRYFENKSLREVGASLKISDDAAQKRVSRAVERLREFFSKRSVTIGASGLAVLISANAVQSAPIGLAKVVATVAVAKGAAAGGSTLTLAKGALKIMAWTQAKTAMVVGVGVLLAAGTTVVTVKKTKEHSEHQGYQWQVQTDDSEKLLMAAPPMVKILPTKFSQPIIMPDGTTRANGATIINLPNTKKRIAFNVLVEDMIFDAYDFDFGMTRAILPKLPTERYDFISSLPNNSSAALAEEIKRKFGFIAKRETIETNVLLLMLKQPNATGLKPSSTDSNRNRLHGDFMAGDYTDGRYSKHNLPLSYFAFFCEDAWQIPVIDRTGLTNTFDIDFSWQQKNGDPKNKALKQALLDQLGLELVPSRQPIEMLVVERAKD
jgi:uncharacterized protein (TIGR03435 family)